MNETFSLRENHRGFFIGQKVFCLLAFFPAVWAEAVLKEGGEA
jgi:hypothetical protein